MQRLMEESADEPATTGRQRVAIVSVAFLATALVIAVVLVLGAIAYAIRFQGDHESRLARVMQHEPTVDQLTQALENEGTSLLAAPTTSAEMLAAVERWGARDRQGILERAGRWPTLRVYDAHRMSYFIFFDEHGIMRDFVCSRP